MTLARGAYFPISSPRGESKLAHAKPDWLSWRHAAEQLGAAADPARVGILLALEQGERTAALLAAEAGCSPAATLRHLGQLTEAGFLEVTSVGRSVVYELTSAGRALVKTIRSLERVWPSLCAVVGATAIAAGAVAWAIGLQGFRSARRSAPRPEAGSAFLAGYIQLAFFWLRAGLALLVAGQLSATVRGIEPPRAYLGATRHALTVGFLTTLILGVGQRLLPILSHDLLAWPRLVVLTFVCIAIGNALRVTGELATLAWPIVFRLLPISAVLELTALALFAVNTVRTLWPGRDPLLRTGQATPMTRVATLLAEYPWLEDHLVASGRRYIGRVRSVPAS